MVALLGARQVGKTILAREIKRTDSPRVSPSMRSALGDLRLDSLDVIHAGEQTFPMAKQIRAVPLARLEQELRPLRRE